MPSSVARGLNYFVDVTAARVFGLPAVGTVVALTRLLVPGCRLLVVALFSLCLLFPRADP